MTINQRDSLFLNRSNIVPGNAARVLDTKLQDLPENELELFKAIIKDFEDFKTSLSGITRLYDDMLFIYNNPTQNNTGVLEALRMDKYGNFAIGTEYPRWPRCKVDVNGALYAIPQLGTWFSDANAAGPGLYVWGSELFNPNSDIYSRVAGNTQIRIDEPGIYEAAFGVYASNTVDATGTNVDFQLRLNTVPNFTFSASLMTNDLAYQCGVRMGSISRGDVVDINLVGANNNRIGATFDISWLQICKVN